MATIDPREHARIALIARVTDAIRLWGIANDAAETAQKTVLEAEVTKKAASETIEKCVASARDLWGMDLKAEFENHLRELRPQPVSASAPQPTDRVTTEKALASATTEKPKPIREFVLEAAQAAYPGAVRAATLRKQLADGGRPTHDKTVGMTLYRLLRDRVLRRKGWDWYFVPEADRWNGEPPTERESPASDAGLF